MANRPLVFGSRRRRLYERGDVTRRSQQERRVAGGSVAVAVDRMNLVLWVWGLEVRGFITLLPPAEAWDTLA